MPTIAIARTDAVLITLKVLLWISAELVLCVQTITLGSAKSEKSLTHKVQSRTWQEILPSAALEKGIYER